MTPHPYTNVVGVRVACSGEGKPDKPNVRDEYLKNPVEWLVGQYAKAAEYGFDDIMLVLPLGGNCKPDDGSGADLMHWDALIHLRERFGYDLDQPFIDAMDIAHLNYPELAANTVVYMGGLDPYRLVGTHEISRFWSVIDVLREAGIQRVVVDALAAHDRDSEWAQLVREGLLHLGMDLSRHGCEAVPRDDRHAPMTGFCNELFYRTRRTEPGRVIPPCVRIAVRETAGNRSIVFTGDDYVKHVAACLVTGCGTYLEPTSRVNWRPKAELMQMAEAHEATLYGGTLATQAGEVGR